jgi:hypothetical protein
MGDNLLMKNILLSILIASIALQSSDDLSWVDEQVNAIKPPRSGEENQKISTIKDPFIFLKKNMPKGFKYVKKTTKKPYTSTVAKKSYRKKSSTSTRIVNYIRGPLKLSAIINNSALINGKWYKLGDIINNYKISKIDNNSLTLKYKTKTKILTTASNAKLNFKR